MQNDNCNNVTISPAASVSATTTPSATLAREPATAESVALKAGNPDGAASTSTPELQAPPTRIKPKFVPRHVCLPRQADAQRAAEPEVPADTVRVAYSFRICGGTEVVVDVRSSFDLPLALGPESLAQTDVHFPELLDRIVVQPLSTRFHSFLQMRFEMASRAAIEEQCATEPPPFQPPAAGGIRLAKSANGASFGQPEIDAKPLATKMPGGAMESFRKNGG